MNYHPWGISVILIRMKRRNADWLNLPISLKIWFNHPLSRATCIRAAEIMRKMIEPSPEAVKAMKKIGYR